MSTKRSKSSKMQFGNVVMYQKYGALHNERGPAYIDYDNQLYQYYKRGKLHRENGPAHINKINNQIFWYIDGEMLSFSEWCEKTTLDKDRLVMLVLEYQ